VGDAAGARDVPGEGDAAGEGDAIGDGDATGKGGDAVCALPGAHNTSVKATIRRGRYRKRTGFSQLPPTLILR
jgi:hypothetical protein